MQVTNSPGFKAYFVDSDIKRSFELLQGHSFLQRLEMAKQGDVDARNSLFYTAYPAINSVFFKNYCYGSTPYRMISQGEDYVFLSEAFLSMFKSHPSTPLNKFIPTPSNSEEYNIKGFLYYTTGYLKALVKHLKTKEDAEDTITYDTSPSEVEVTNHTEISELKSKLNLDSFVEDLHIQEMFVKYLLSIKDLPRKMHYNVLLLRSKHYSGIEIAKKLNITKAHVFNIIKINKEKFLEFLAREDKE